MRHTGCRACAALKPSQVEAPDGVARHNTHTYLVNVPHLLNRGLGHVAEGQWQAGLSFLDEAVREIQDARRLIIAQLTQLNTQKINQRGGHDA
jgi:hypothetical protein